jgi:hypothetical protein
MITFTFRRSNCMNNQAWNLRRIGEGLLALVVTIISLVLLQFALAA